MHSTAQAFRTRLSGPVNASEPGGSVQADSNQADGEWILRRGTRTGRWTTAEDDLVERQHTSQQPRGRLQVRLGFQVPSLVETAGNTQVRRQDR